MTELDTGQWANVNRIFEELDDDYIQRCEAGGIALSRYDFALEWLDQCISRSGFLSKEYVLAASRLQEYTLKADRSTTAEVILGDLFRKWPWEPGRSPERWELGDAVTTDEKSGLIASLSSLKEPGTILDPACGCGLLLHAVLNEIPYSSAIGISGDPRLSKIASAVLHDRNHLEILDSDSKGRVDSERYDLIVSDPPPTRWSLSKQGKFSSYRRYPRWKSTHALAVWASEHLTADGTAMICVDPSFFWDKNSDIVHRHIVSNGCRIKAAFYFEKLLGNKADGCLVVIENGSQKKLFVGGASYQNSDLIENFIKFRGAKNPSLGRLCELSEFQSFERLVSQDNLKRLGSKSGFKIYPANKVFIRAFPPPWNWNQEIDYKDYQDTLVCFNPISRKFRFGPFYSSRTDWILAVDPEVVNLQFVVDWFNTTDLGTATLDSAQRADTKGKAVDVKYLVNHIQLYLPSKDKQEALLGSHEKLEKIRSDLQDLSSNLISAGNNDIQGYVDRIEAIKIDDTYLDWVDTLPYPLASILSRHQDIVVDGSEVDKLRTLSHFFEALAAFVATVHLSAYSRRTMWAYEARKMVEKTRLPEPFLHQTHFGDWIRIAEHFSAANKKWLKDTDGSDVIKSTYSVAEYAIIESLGASKLLQILQRANQIRNNHLGHGGAIGPQEADRLHSELFTYILETRSIFGRRWLSYELIQPASSTYSSGEHTYSCSRLTGRSNTFPKGKVVTREPLEANRLHLYNSTSRQALALLPFVRVLTPSEKSRAGFYFYNRQKNGVVRYVSYENEEWPEYDDKNKGAGDFLGRLFPSF